MMTEVYYKSLGLHRSAFLPIAYKAACPIQFSVRVGKY